MPLRTSYAEIADRLVREYISPDGDRVPQQKTTEYIGALAELESAKQARIQNLIAFLALQPGDTLTTTRRRDQAKNEIAQLLFFEEPAEVTP